MKLKVTIYTAKGCSHCRQAKEYLNKNGIVYKEVDMSKGGIPELQQIKRKFKEMGLKEYPIIMIKEDEAKSATVLQGFNEEELDKVFENGNKT